MQLRQTKHSLLRRSPCGSDAPSQLFRQRSQSVQRTGSRSIRQSENRLKIPSNAPSGQTTRQKNRGNPPVGHEEADEDQADDPGLPVLARLGVDALGRLVHGGQHARGHRPDRQRDRVEQADLQGAVVPLVLLGRRGDARFQSPPRRVTRPICRQVRLRGMPARSCRGVDASWG